MSAPLLEDLAELLEDCALLEDCTELEDASELEEISVTKELLETGGSWDSELRITLSLETGGGGTLSLLAGGKVMLELLTGSGTGVGLTVAWKFLSVARSTD